LGFLGGSSSGVEFFAKKKQLRSNERYDNRMDYQILLPVLKGEQNTFAE
jgi:hypothetical protein